MELESYFDFSDEEDILIKGTRIGLQHVVELFNEGASPEEITARFRALSLEQAYATITYYLANREKVDTYVKGIHDFMEAGWQEQQKNPSAVALRVRKIKEERARQKQQDEQALISQI